ncbi:MAG: TetR family transcriptional regulator [Streptosporangiales bacterium]
MDAVGEATPVGRRERKKRATREALQDAALRLALARGPENVTIEAICEEADVAQRTFFNHFSGKDEALAGGPPIPGPEAWDDLAAGGTGNLWDDIHARFRACAEQLEESREELLARRQLVEQYPPLLPRKLAQFAESEHALAAAVAARSGTDPELDAYPQLVAGMAVTTMRVAMRRWTLSSGERPLAQYVDEAFDLVSRTPLGGH